METFLISVGALVPMLLLLVVVHELGHFATARSLGVKVLEFGVGFPPRAFGLYSGRTRVLIDGDTRFLNLSSAADLRKGQFVRVDSAEDPQGNLVARVIETPLPKRGLVDRLPGRGARREQPDNDLWLKHEGKIRGVEGESLILADLLYSVNWLPLGGFVRLAGESNPSVPRSLAGKGVGTRALVLVAGPLMNAVLPIVFFTVLLMVPQDVVVGQVLVKEVSDGSPAQEAGVQAGDTILRASGHRIENPGDLIRSINLSGGSDMEWVVDRGGRQQILNVTPRFQPEKGRWLVGILTEVVNVHTESRSSPPWVAIPNSFVNTWELLVLLKQGIFGAFSQGSAPQLSGPIGIAQVTGEFTREGGLAGWLAITILLSINLAILNILPIPMLDGGRLVFVILEWVRRGKRVTPEREGLVHLIGFAVLIGFILLISANDINRLIQGRSFLGG